MKIEKSNAWPGNVGYLCGYLGTARGRAEGGNVGTLWSVVMMCSRVLSSALAFYRLSWWSIEEGQCRFFPHIAVRGVATATWFQGPGKTSVKTRSYVMYVWQLMSEYSLMPEPQPPPSPLALIVLPAPDILHWPHIVQQMNLRLCVVIKGWGS